MPTQKLAAGVSAKTLKQGQKKPSFERGSQNPRGGSRKTEQMSQKLDLLDYEILVSSGLVRGDW